MAYKTSTGVILRGSLIGELVHRVHEHETANSLPLTPPELIETSVCEDCFADGRMNVCYDPNARPDAAAQAEAKRSFPLTRAVLEKLANTIRSSMKVNIETAKNGVKMLAGWLGQGYATQEEADRRARACVDCPKNVDVTCSSCAVGAFLLSLVKAKGKRSTKLDPQLLHCQECGCSNQLKIWVPKAVILEKTPVDQMARLPENCWIKQEAKS